MKKSLSLLLAIALIFGAFASVVSAADPVTAQEKFDFLKDKKIFSGINANGDAALDKKMSRAEFARVLGLLDGLDVNVEPTSQAFTDVGSKHWAYQEIGAVNKAGLMIGIGGGKFNPNGNMKVQDLAIALAKVLGLTSVAGATVDGADAYAAPYIKALLNAGVSFPTNYKEAATREVLVNASYAAYVKITTPPVPVVTTATKVASVAASNLKEVVVTFDGTLNQKSAESLASYTLKDEDGSVITLTSAALQSDNKTVVLTVNGLGLNNQDAYKLSVNSVKGSDAAKAAVSATDVAFKPVDAALPTVEKVESLGNKAVKVTFSEPVTSTSTVADTFKLDDTVVSGILSGSGTRTLIIQLFSPLAVGEHTLAINNKINDFALYNLIATSQKFTVADDKTAPTIAAVKDVTLEGATVVFSEDVKDLQAQNGSNYYWMNGSSKNYADATVTKIDGKTFKLTFSGSAKLPAVATDLYVTNIADYSDNVIADGSKASVTAVVDQTRPEVVSSVFDGASQLKLTFSKTVDLTTFKASNVIIKDSKGAVVYSYGVNVSEGYTGSSQTLTLNFSSTLAAGTYSVEVSGLKDNTTLANTMLPYTSTVTTTDQVAPNVMDITGTGNVYYVTFDKAMDVATSASILNPENYYLNYTQSGSARVGKLPTGTNIVPVNGNQGVIITLPSSVTAVAKITIQGVKSASGVYLSGYAQSPTIAANFGSNLAYATAKNTVYVKFNQPVSARASLTGITVATFQVADAVIDSSDSTLVKLTLSSLHNLSDTNATSAAVVVPGGAFKNLNGALSDAVSVNAGDAIAPNVLRDATTGKVVVDTSATGVVYNPTSHIVTITYQEPIKVTNDAILINNFSAYKANGLPLTYGVDFNIDATNLLALKAGTATTIVLNFDLSVEGTVDVAVNNSNGNIVDPTAVYADGTARADLAAVGFDTRDSSAVSGSIQLADVTLPTVSGIVENASATVLTVTFNEAMNQAAVETIANWTFTGAATITSVAYDTATKKATVTLTVAAVSGNTLLAKPTIVDVAGNAVNTSKDLGTRGAQAAGSGTYTIS